MDHGEVVYVPGHPGLFADELWIKSADGDSYVFHPHPADVAIALRLCAELPWWVDILEGEHFVSPDLANKEN